MAREHAEDASPTLPSRMPREDHAGQRIPGRRHARGVQRSVLAASTGARSISTDRALGRQSNEKRDRLHRLLRGDSAADCAAPGGSSPAGVMGKGAGSVEGARGPREGISCAEVREGGRGRQDAAHVSGSWHA